MLFLLPVQSGSMIKGLLDFSTFTIPADWFYCERQPALSLYPQKKERKKEGDPNKIVHSHTYSHIIILSLYIFYSKPK